MVSVNTLMSFTIYSGLANDIIRMAFARELTCWAKAVVVVPAAIRMRMKMILLSFFIDVAVQCEVRYLNIITKTSFFSYHRFIKYKSCRSVWGGRAVACGAKTDSVEKKKSLESRRFKALFVE